jgi:hypothetical protein
MGPNTYMLSLYVCFNIVNALNRKQHCAALHIDPSKAFNTVDHALLLRMLAEIGLDQAASSHCLNGSSQSAIGNETLVTMYSHKMYGL